MIEDKKDLKYQSHILHFCDRNDIRYCAFAPSNFIKEIRRRCKADARPYFCSYGTIEYDSKQIAEFSRISTGNTAKIRLLLQYSPYSVSKIGLGESNCAMLCIFLYISEPSLIVNK